MRRVHPKGGSHCEGGKKPYEEVRGGNSPGDWGGGLRLRFRQTTALHELQMLREASDPIRKVNAKDDYFSLYFQPGHGRGRGGWGESVIRPACLAPCDTEGTGVPE